MNENEVWEYDDYLEMWILFDYNNIDPANGEPLQTEWTQEEYEEQTGQNS